MRKINNGQKFHSNNNSSNPIYSLNYKFDSVCSAGKFSGTALDLIKKYNELAKEAHSNGNYVEMEVFRQYAEHYRKIVTEINERKNQSRENRPQNNADTNTMPTEEENQPMQNNDLVETQAAAPQSQTKESGTAEVSENTEPVVKKIHRRRSFTTVEVANTTEQLPTEEQSTAKPRRSRRAINKAAIEKNEENISAEA